MNMKSFEAGDILHCTGNGIISKAIQIFTKSRITHTAFVIEIWGQLFVIDAQKDGVNPRPLKDWRNKYKYQIHISRRRSINIKNLRNKSIRAMSKSGITPYDLKSLLLIQPWYQLTGKWLDKERVSNDKRMYCSEFVAWIEEFRAYNRMSPNDVFEKCIRENKTFVTFRLS